MPNRPKQGAGGRSNGNGGVGSFLRGLAGAYGSAGKIEDTTDQATDVPEEGDVDAKMASGIREPIGSNLRAKKPGLGEIILTRGQAGRDYRELDAKLQMQQLQNKFAAGQATSADAAAMARLQEEYKLKDKNAASEHERTESTKDKEYEKNQQAYATLRPLLAQQLGIPVEQLPTDHRQMGLLLGDIGKTAGFGAGFSGMQNTIGRNRLSNTQLASQQRAAESPAGDTIERANYLVSRNAPVHGENLADRAAALAEANGATNRLATLGAMDLANQKFSFESTSPRMIGDGVYSVGQNIFGIAPATKGGPAIVTGPDGRPMMVNQPPSAPSVRQINTGGKRTPVGTIPATAPTIGAPEANGGNPAPAEAQAPMQPTISSPLSATGRFSGGIDMTPEMVDIAQSNRTPQDKISLLMPLAQRAAILQQQEEAKRRFQESGERRIPLGNLWKGTY